MHCLVMIDTLHKKQMQCNFLASCSRQQALQKLQCWHPYQAPFAEFVHEQHYWRSYSPVAASVRPGRPKGVRMLTMLAT